MWYVIRTKAGSEEAVRKRAKKLLAADTGRDCKVLYCIRKKRYLGEWHEEKERLLPGYVFLVADDPEGAAGVLKGIPESVKLPGYGEKACPVGKEEEELLSRLTGEKDEIGMSYGVIEGGVLKIERGVLSGLEASVRKIDRHKRKGYIGLTLPGEGEKLVGVGLEITEKS